MSSANVSPDIKYSNTAATKSTHRLHIVTQQGCLIVGRASAGLAVSIGKRVNSASSECMQYLVMPLHALVVVEGSATAFTPDSGLCV